MRDAQPPDPDRDSLAGTFPAWKRLAPLELSRLRAPEPVLGDACQTALVEMNPWLQALRSLGHDFAPEARVVPIEEGETSLNCNAHQALASLFALLTGRGQGVRLTVIGTLAGGNHGLDHTIAILCGSFGDPARARAALQETLGDAARASAEALFADCRRNVRKVFFSLPLPVQRARALRLPPARILAPEADRLRALAVALGLDPWLRDLLSSVREAMGSAGLQTVADLFILLRAALIRHLGSVLGAGGLSYIPTSLEYLIARGTDEELGGLSLRELAARWHAVFGLAPPSRERRITGFGGGRFRVLNYYDPVELLTRGASRAGWRILTAAFANGEVIAGRQTAELAGLPVRELLARGYGLSGKLIYLAVRAVNGGRVCNQIFLSPRSDVFAALADPGHPGLVLALQRLDVHACWREEPDGRTEQLDLLAFVNWLGRCPDPPRTLAQILGRLSDRWCDPRSCRARLVLGERPGSFRLTE